jgi:hypothetical protein
VTIRNRKRLKLGMEKNRKLASCPIWPAASQQPSTSARPAPAPRPRSRHQQPRRRRGPPGHSAAAQRQPSTALASTTRAAQHALHTARGRPQAEQPAAPSNHPARMTGGPRMSSSTFSPLPPLFSSPRHPPAMVTPPAPRFDRTSAIGRRQRVRNHPATPNPNLESAGTLHVSRSRLCRPPRRHGWGWR